MSGDKAREAADWWTRFQALLDDQNLWPAEYVFKFIVPAAGIEELRRLFGSIPIVEKPSRNGRYLSVTATMTIHSSDEIVAMYTAAGQIEGVISL